MTRLLFSFGTIDCSRELQLIVLVTIPLALPGLAAATVLAFARALGEFGATLTFAGSLEGVTRTLPLEIYLERVTDPAAAADEPAASVSIRANRAPTSRSSRTRRARSARPPPSAR